MAIWICCGLNHDHTLPLTHAFLARWNANTRLFPGKQQALNPRKMVGHLDTGPSGRQVGCGRLGDSSNWRLELHEWMATHPIHTWRRSHQRSVWTLKRGRRHVWAGLGIPVPALSL